MERPNFGPLSRTLLAGFAGVCALACGPESAGSDDGGGPEPMSCTEEGAIEVDADRACVCFEGTWACTEGQGCDANSDCAAYPLGTFVRLLFVVDASPGMASVQRELARSAANLLTALTDRGLSVAATVISQDAGTVGDACPSPAAPAGTPVFESCLGRLGAFGPGPDAGPDPAAACTDVCTTDAFVPFTDPVDGSSLAGVLAHGADGAADAAEALACAIPLGNTGCRFAQPVAAIDAFAKDPPALWTALGATDVVVFAGDGPECSTADPSIFDPSGSKVFFEDPNASAPTEAVCWNAGVACEGDPSGYDACVPADFAADGSPAPTSGEAVLVSVAEPYGLRIDWKAFVPNSYNLLAAVVGGFDPQDPGAEPTYSKGTDPGFSAEHGIDPACTGNGTSAVPPVRTLDFAEALHDVEELEGPVRISACGASFGGGLDTIVEAVEARRIRCAVAGPCAFDVDPATDGVQPLCNARLLVPGREPIPLLPCGPGEGAAGVPEGAVGCLRVVPTDQAPGCGAVPGEFAFEVELAQDADPEVRMGGEVTLGSCLAGAVDEAAGTCDPTRPGA